MHFKRILKYVFQQKPILITSIVCAVIVSILMAVNISMMMPIMRMMLEDEGIHGGVDSWVIKDRTGYSLKVVGPKELSNGEYEDYSPIIVSDYSRKPKMTDSGQVSSQVADTEKPVLEIGDKILSVWAAFPDIPVSGDIQNPLEAARMIANAQGSVWINILSQQENNPEIIELKLNHKDFWNFSTIAQKLADFIPRGIGAKYKYQCIAACIWAIFFIALIRCVLRFIQEYLVKKISLTTINMLRNDTFKRAIRMPLSFYTNEGVSDTISRFIQDTNRVNRGVAVLFGKAIREPLKVIALFIAAYQIEPKITLITACAAPVILLVITKIGKKSKKATTRTLKRWSVLLGKLQEAFFGIKVVKGYHREDWETERFVLVNNNLLKKQLKKAKVEASSSPIIESLAFLGGCVGMLFALQMLEGSQMSIDKFVGLVMLLATGGESGRKLGDVIPAIQEANASAQRVFELYDRTIEQDAPDAVEIPPVKESIEFRDVCFTYPGSQEPNLADVNLSVKAGQTIAVVGPNGSGKTTLLSMIPRFFTLDNGRILIDGVDITKATLGSLRDQLGIVTQNTVVFNDTVANNIAYGMPDMPLEKIKQAAMHAYADEFINEKANGYNEMIGEQGSTLSGGQLQRLAIARAILRDPAILIFDEATSQIDSDSEAKIQKALKEFSQGRTSFIIAHRLSTIVDADLIVVMEKGRIAATGTHAELLEISPLYKQLYQMQFGAQAEKE